MFDFIPLWARRLLTLVLFFPYWTVGFFLVLLLSPALWVTRGKTGTEVLEAYAEWWDYDFRRWINGN